MIENYPSAKFYVMCRLFLYSEGIVYEVIEEILNRGYSIILCFVARKMIIADLQ